MDGERRDIIPGPRDLSSYFLGDSGPGGGGISDRRSAMFDLGNGDPAGACLATGLKVHDFSCVPGVRSCSCDPADVAVPGLSAACGRNQTLAGRRRGAQARNPKHEIRNNISRIAHNRSQAERNGDSAGLGFGSIVPIRTDCFVLRISSFVLGKWVKTAV